MCKIKLEAMTNKSYIIINNLVGVLPININESKPSLNKLGGGRPPQVTMGATPMGVPCI